MKCRESQQNVTDLYKFANRINVKIYRLGKHQVLDAFSHFNGSADHKGEDEFKVKFYYAI